MKTETIIIEQGNNKRITLSREEFDIMAERVFRGEDKTQIFYYINKAEWANRKT